MHISIPKQDTMEYIQQKQISPLISKGVCKVCYVGQNRNNTVISKEVAAEMGRKILGSPVVGFFDKDEQDFRGHEREIVVSEGKFEIVDITRPYGFVPTDANVWFETFIDDGVEHEYLCTDVYLWTGAYPESQRIIDRGNNHSMELDSKNSTGFWTNDENTNARIFIYNDTLIEKLCILGENVEPCFEGASIQAAFSLGPEFEAFKATMFSKMNELQEMLNKGGSQEPMDNEKVVTEEEVELQEVEVEVNTQDAEFEKKNKDEEEEKETEEKDDEEKKKKSYNLEEVVEYTELLSKYETLQNDYATLQATNADLNTALEALNSFKLQVEREQKENMINSFTMLTDADKSDVKANIDKYTLEEIEAKLAILCVRNKVNFNLDTEVNNTPEDKQQELFSLNSAVEGDNAPAWIKAVRETANQ